MASVPIFSDINWASSAYLNLEFRTDLFKARNGLETRSAQREFPRLEMQFRTVGGRKNYNGFKGGYAAALGGRVAFPDFTRAVKATTDGSATLFGDFEDHAFITGGPVFITDGRISHATIIGSQAGSSMQVQTGFPADLDENVRVFPGIEGRVRGGLTASYVSSRAFESEVALQAFADQVRVHDLMDHADFQWYRDKPVILWEPNWADPVQEDWSMDEQGFDPGYGLPTFTPQLKSPIRVSAFSTILRSRREVQELVAFFCYCRGQQASFYAPTWVDDFTFRSPVTEGQTTIRCAGTGLYSLFNGSDVFKSIAIPFRGEVHLAGVVDVVPVGRDVDVTISQPIPANVAGASAGSWLLRQRFSSDRMEVEFLTDGVATCQIGTTSVLEDFPALLINGDEFTVNGFYVTIGSSRDIPVTQRNNFGGYAVSINGDFLT